MTNTNNLTLFVLLLALAACSSSPDSTAAVDEPDSDADAVTDADSTLPDTAEEVTSAPRGCLNPGTDGATALCLEPTQTPEYYVEQALKYFDTLDVDADPESIPNYSDLVARWEWPPWLLLTGFDRETMITTAEILRVGDPSTVPVRDCRFFDTQPFARCYVEFAYEGGPCPIYEEFVFNDAGEMTFIEAWSDIDGLRPMAADDTWAEADGFPRLSTRVPGLGNADGLVDIDGRWMREAGEADDDVAEFALRASDQWQYWMDEVAGADPDFFAIGCGWDGE